MVGDLKLVSKDMKDLFITALPLTKAAGAKKVILMGPMPRYLVAKCCEDASHLTNYDDEDYVEEMKKFTPGSQHHLPEAAENR